MHGGPADRNKEIKGDSILQDQSRGAIIYNLKKDDDLNGLSDIVRGPGYNHGSPKRESTIRDKTAVYEPDAHVLPHLTGAAMTRGAVLNNRLPPQPLLSICLISRSHADQSRPPIF